MTDIESNMTILGQCYKWLNNNMYKMKNRNKALIIDFVILFGHLAVVPRTVCPASYTWDFSPFLDVKNIGNKREIFPQL